jgi:hypothetical protein
MKENQILWIGEAILAVLLTIIASIVAIINISRGRVPHPHAFIIVLIGVVLFVIAKASVIKHNGLFTFGTKNMGQIMSNFYRFGYWLMFVGCLLTFVR